MTANTYYNHYTNVCKTCTLTEGRVYEFPCIISKSWTSI